MQMANSIVEINSMSHFFVLLSEQPPDFIAERMHASLDKKEGIRNDWNSINLERGINLHG